jgi:hypothetical protein
MNYTQNTPKEAVQRVDEPHGLGIARFIKQKPLNYVLKRRLDKMSGSCGKRGLLDYEIRFCDRFEHAEKIYGKHIFSYK